jgi:hypothetical protein
MPRHLHESDAAMSLCGLPNQWATGQLGARDLVRTVHVTKARKGDCAGCRNAYRARVRDVRVGSGQRDYLTRAERAEALSS